MVRKPCKSEQSTLQSAYPTCSDSKHTLAPVRLNKGWPQKHITVCHTSTLLQKYTFNESTPVRVLVTKELAHRAKVEPWQDNEPGE